MIAHHREFVDRSMSTSMTPYREIGTIATLENIPVKKTGLIPFVPPPPPHKCDFPKKYEVIVVVEKKFLFFFKKRKNIKEERVILPGSLYRCPDCLKVALFKDYGSRYNSEVEWRINKEAADAWQDKTGEFVDGES